MGLREVYLLIIAFLIINRSAVLAVMQENVIQFNGTYSEIMSFEFNNSYQIVISYPESNSTNSYTINTWVNSKGCPKFPVIVVVRHDREVLSWQMPFPVYRTHKPGEAIQFLNTSRTLCPSHMYKHEKNNKSSSMTQNFNVALSTNSADIVNVSVVVREEMEFSIKTDHTYSIVVSPSQPKYVFYGFSDNGIDSVLIEIVSNDDVCLTISLQDSFCPVFDLNEDITFQGKYQTVSRKGGQSIRRKDFPHGFFLVFVAQLNSFVCSLDENLNSQFPVELTSVVNFTISKDVSDYRKASGITIAVLLGFCLISALMVFTFTRWGNMEKLWNRNDADGDGNENDEITLLDQGRTPRNLLQHPRNGEQIDELLATQNLQLTTLALYPAYDNRKSFNYLWHILSIAVFYSIPVVQLLVSYQMMVNRTGNQDICYYNFLCAHPAYGFSDFNHIFSNVGYLSTGLLFIAVTYYRHYIIRRSRGSQDLGIPVHDGLYYAMGVALIIEGLLSACYHICPSQTHFQFDTSFMYVMVVLCMVKLYQNRHPDVNATAYSTFAVLGIAIFVAMVGLLYGTLLVWILFALVYTILCIYVSFKIYFFGYVLIGLLDCRTEWDNAEEGFRNKMRTLEPLKKPRFRILIIANLLNYTMLIAGLVLYEDRSSNFGSFLLALLMGNAVLHTIFYTTMKLVHGERICVEAIIYGLLMIASWAGSAIFFLNAATLWSVSPAESRQKNQSCILMNFYDTHDVWHFLSAGALYFTFMYLQCLDDDIIDKNRNHIPVF